MMPTVLLAYILIREANLFPNGFRLRLKFGLFHANSFDLKIRSNKYVNQIRKSHAFKHCYF